MKIKLQRNRVVRISRETYRVREIHKKHTDGEDSENFEEDKVRNWDKDVENVAERKRRKEGDERIWREDT